MRLHRYLGSLLLVLLVIALAWTEPSQAASNTGRAALVVGNAAYPDSDTVLPTPLGDARAVADALKARGFTVESGENLGREAMQGAVDRFLRSVEPGSVAVVYFAGYGIQLRRKNYLVPVDARIWTEADVLRDGVSVDTLLEGLARRSAEARVIVLDASRRNPFERRFRSFSMGLAPLPSTAGLLGLSSAAAGSVMNDASGSQSVFGRELAHQIGVPDLGAEQAFAAVRDAVSRDSRSQQVPALVSQLDMPFSFDPLARPLPPKKPVAEPREPPADTVLSETKAPPETKPQAALPEVKNPEPPQGTGKKGEPLLKEPDPPASEASSELKDFDTANTLGTRKSFEEFLDKHGSGPLADRARQEIRRIDESEQRAAASKQPETRYSAAEAQRKNDLDTRIAGNPADEAAFYERGLFHAQRGEQKLAIADFDQSIRLNPSNPEAFNNRCWMQVMENELQRALSDCNEALRLRPTFVDALDSRGLVHLKNGSMRAAVADYDAALRIDPSHSSSLYGRGLARMKLGENIQGRKDLAGALRLNPGIDKDFALYGIR